MKYLASALVNRAKKNGRNRSEVEQLSHPLISQLTTAV
jgi:hypothetical protein